jgi:hypothetical protein
MNFKRKRRGKKGRNFQIARRAMKRKEKDSDVTKDVAIGGACRRGWGSGVAKGIAKK